MAAALRAAPSCTISSTAVNFGNYNPLNVASVTGTSTLTFQCPSGVPRSGITYTISLSSGSGTYVQRTLTSGGNVLNYNLYTDSTLTTVWGDGSSGSTTVSTTVSRPQARAGVTNTVYGNIPAQQDMIPGSYTDTITVTVTF
ncbi:MAG: spore coat protein U domain-containing protein [Gammaproteobacteria bacterium]|nr:spore coat protein U domain-containing protein [Gammaproteobacteria bacterium]